MDLFNSDSLTEMPFGLPGKIYRSPMPFHPGDDDGELLDQYHQAGIQVVVLLLPRSEYLQKSGRDLAGIYHRAGIKLVELPVLDYTTPDPILLEKALDETLTLARSGNNVAIHCYAGFGRTGTFLACMAVRQLNKTGQEAIDWVRQFVPPALENEAQTYFVVEYGERHAHHQR